MPSFCQNSHTIPSASVLEALYAIGTRSVCALYCRKCFALAFHQVRERTHALIFRSEGKQKSEVLNIVIMVSRTQQLLRMQNV